MVANAQQVTSRRTLAERARYLLATTATINIVVVAVSERSLSVPVFYVLFFILGSVLLIRPRKWGSHNSQTSLLFTIVYYYNVTVAVLMYYWFYIYYGAPYLGGGSDDHTYEMLAQLVAKTLGPFDYSSVSSLLRSSFYGYIYLLSWIERIGWAWGGAHTLNPRLLNSFAIALLSLVVYKLGVTCSFSHRTSLRAAYMSGLFPLMSYWGSVIMRDVLIVLLVVVGTYLTTRLFRAITFRSTILLLTQYVVLWIVLRELRLYSAVMLLLTSAAYLASVAKPIATRRGGASIAVILVAIIVLIAGQELWLPSVERINTRRDIYTEHSISLSNSDTGLARYVFAAPAPYSYLLRTGYGLITPVPIPSLRPELFLALGTMLWFFLMPFAFSSLFPSFRDISRRVAVVFFLAFFVATTQTSFKVVHFLHWYPFAFLLAFDGLERHRKQIIVVLITFSWLAAILTLAYLLLKS